MDSRYLPAIPIAKALALLTGLLLPISVHAASLDDLYGQLVPSKKILSETQFEDFRMREKGIHGNASYAGFKSKPAVDTLGERLRLPLTAQSELSVGYTQGFNNSYARPTRDNADAVVSMQRYHIDQDLMGDAGLRHRSGNSEYFISALNRRMETNWNYATSEIVAPLYFNYFHSRFLDVRSGVRTLSSAGEAEGKGLDLYDRPLLVAGQTGWEAQGGLRSGKLIRDGVYYVANRYNYEYSFRTTGHAVTSGLYRLGLGGRSELEAGLAWESPFKYKFAYEYTRLLGTSYFVNGTYSYRQWFEVPLALRVRPSPQMELRPSAVFRYINQKLEYWEKKEDNTRTNFPEKKLDCYGVDPSLKFIFVTRKERAASSHAYDLEEKFLAKGQWAFEAEWLREMNILDRAHGTGGYNLADPYEEYLRPVANFFSGTEYAAFISGNSGSTPADVRPQNSSVIKGRVTLGLSGRLSVGLGAGYRTAASAHQLSLGDISERFYKFKPVYFFDSTVNWQFCDNALLALDVHFVPAYQTIINSSAAPEEYKATTRYTATVVKVKILF